MQFFDRRSDPREEELRLAGALLEAGREGQYDARRRQRHESPESAAGKCQAQVHAPERNHGGRMHQERGRTGDSSGEIPTLRDQPYGQEQQRHGEAAGVRLKFEREHGRAGDSRA